MDAVKTMTAAEADTEVAKVYTLEYPDDTSDTWDD
jgi:hypothetical protein